MTGTLGNLADLQVDAGGNSRTSIAELELIVAKWLMKSEPGTYGWEDLVGDGRTDWDGVRNNAARLHLRAMQTGDEAFFYHSGADRAIVGIARIAGPGEADGDDGSWVKVPVEPHRPLERPVTLAEMKKESSLSAMALLRQSRLSVSPVTDEEWSTILAMASRDELGS
ncbi:EVE domain-containing protein [Sphingomonas sp. LY160]|uniref:EVE domain-containing protein n=1 Tax=Sphingomonas sp. LY160 TaxID=3095342 RepID=UPI002ADEC0DB|nr:EVE domain-containing protein [Sphingomonas sp. LY160]MEA1073157.1 EVE domain-containing protein [Sphingomonas sp. LY160]